MLNLIFALSKESKATSKQHTFTKGIKQTDTCKNVVNVAYDWISITDKHTVYTSKDERMYKVNE